jgi:hypothetical protein
MATERFHHTCVLATVALPFCLTVEHGGYAFERSPKRSGPGHATEHHPLNIAVLLSYNPQCSRYPTESLFKKRTANVRRRDAQILDICSVPAAFRSVRGGPEYACWEGTCRFGSCDPIPAEPKVAGFSLVII